MKKSKSSKKITKTEMLFLLRVLLHPANKCRIFTQRDLLIVKQIRKCIKWI